MNSIGVKLINGNTGLQHLNLNLYLRLSDSAR